ncbi:hypothetical protein Trydic_g16096 [Trypoxylus dichotomus]
MIPCTCCNDSVTPHKIVNCFLCDKPYKTDCVDIFNAEARKIPQRVGLTWTCKPCANIGSILNNLETAIVSLREDIKLLKESFPNPRASSLLDVEKVVQEVSEHEKRKYNIIIFGAKESICSSSKDQLVANVNFVKQIYTTLQIDEKEIKPIRSKNN